MSKPPAPSKQAASVRLAEQTPSETETMSEKNSLLYWFPRVAKLGIPTPRTTWIELPIIVMIKILDDPDLLTRYQEPLFSKARDIGFPLFLRTDLASGKHGWLDTCYVPSEERLLPNIWNLIDWNLACNLLPKAIVFRQYIEMDSAFTAFRGTPISREFRFFAEKGRVLCHHPYWPEEAIRSPSVPDYQERLKRLHRPLSGDEHAQLSRWADQASLEMGEAISVDFCHAKDDRWILIDVALAKDSWHPQHKGG